MDINEVIFAAIEYDKGDPRRIQHFIKENSRITEQNINKRKNCSIKKKNAYARV